MRCTPTSRHIGLAVLVTVSPVDKLTIGYRQMKKVTRVTATAFVSETHAQMGNTRVDDDGMALHGNLIATRDDGMVSVTLAGWNTPTTRDRLNGIFEVAGLPYRIVQRKEQPYVVKQGSNAKFGLDLDAWYSLAELAAMFEEA